MSNNVISKEVFTFVKLKNDIPVPSIVRYFDFGHEVMIRKAFCFVVRADGTIREVPFSHREISYLDRHSNKYEELTDFIKVILEEFPENIPILHEFPVSVKNWAEHAISCLGHHCGYKKVPSSHFVKKLIEYML